MKQTCTYMDLPVLLQLHVSSGSNISVMFFDVFWCFWCFLMFLIFFDVFSGCPQFTGACSADFSYRRQWCVGAVWWRYLHDSSCEGDIMGLHRSSVEDVEWTLSRLVLHGLCWILYQCRFSENLFRLYWGFFFFFFFFTMQLLLSWLFHLNWTLLVGFEIDSLWSRQCMI